MKDPQIENTGNNDALAFLRVEVPQEMFTDGDDGTGAQKKQDLFRLKGVSDQWELLRTETVTGENGKAKTTSTVIKRLLVRAQPRTSCSRRYR